MRIKKIQIKNFKSIKDSGDISLTNNIFVLAGQNESGKSSILEALYNYETQVSSKDTLNFELSSDGNFLQEIFVTYEKPDDIFYTVLTDFLDEIIETENLESPSLLKNNILLMKD